MNTKSPSLSGDALLKAQHDMLAEELLRVQAVNAELTQVLRSIDATMAAILKNGRTYIDDRDAIAATTGLIALALRRAGL